MATVLGLSRRPADADGRAGEEARDEARQGDAELGAGKVRGGAAQGGVRELGRLVAGLGLLAHGVPVDGEEGELHGHEQGVREDEQEENDGENGGDGHRGVWGLGLGGHVDDGTREPQST